MCASLFGNQQTFTQAQLFRWFWRLRAIGSDAARARTSSVLDYPGVGAEDLGGSMTARAFLRFGFGLVLFYASLCYGQFTSNVQGVVQDPSGAVVAKAEV